MKVLCADTAMAGYFKSEFPGLRIVEDGVTPKDADLLILTGGSDINPSIYKKQPAGAFGWDDERDEREVSALRSALDNGRTKIFGVCRGMQLINAYLGGTLIQDINPSHPGIHDIGYTSDANIFSWLTKVNSLHHQALSRMGGEYWTPQILGIEPRTGIVEMAIWGNLMFGVQFHPELFEDATKRKFFDLIKKWVADSETISPSAEKPMGRKFSLIDIGAGVSANNLGWSTSVSVEVDPENPTEEEDLEFDEDFDEDFEDSLDEEDTEEDLE